VLKVPIGIGPPNVLQDTITADPTNPTITDLTTVTAVTLDVWAPTGVGGAPQELSWTATIVSATPPVATTPSTLTWQHVFQTTDVPSPGPYRVTAYLSVAGFPDAIPCPPTKTFEGVAKYAL
jgi:hypothetical protein